MFSWIIHTDGYLGKVYFCKVSHFAEKISPPIGVLNSHKRSSPSNRVNLRKRKRDLDETLKKE